METHPHERRDESVDEKILPTYSIEATFCRDETRVCGIWRGHKKKLYSKYTLFSYFLQILRRELVHANPAGGCDIERLFLSEHRDLDAVIRDIDELSFDSLYLIAEDETDILIFHIGNLVKVDTLRRLFEDEYLVALGL